MQEPSATAALVAATLAAIIAVTLLALRLRRARREFHQEVAAWKTRLSLDMEAARTERDLLLDALAEGFLLIDQEARIRFANRTATKLFGGRPLLDRTVRETILDPALSSTVLECLSSGNPTSGRITVQSAVSNRGESRGQAVWDVDAAPLSEARSENAPIRVVIRDVTAEHHTEQIRKDFVANASHELRTPLAIINGYLENLLDDGLVEDADMTRRFLSIMRKHTERIARIVEDMLVISRLESGEAAALKVEPFRMRSCIQDVSERLESVIRNQNAKLVVDMPDNDLTVTGDRFYWTQVLFNLVENALKQNPRPGLTVTVGCKRDDLETTIWVSDDGVGIPSQDLPHIFRRFYRVEKHHSQDEIKGTGLGLSIVKRAVEAHGGAVEVTSVPGEDTRFTIRIPINAEIALEATAEA